MVMGDIFSVENGMKAVVLWQADSRTVNVKHLMNGVTNPAGLVMSKQAG